LHDDGDALLQPREQFNILVAMQEVADLLAQCAEGEGETLGEREGLRLSLRAATDKLNQITTPFAGRRMDARVRSALSGRRVDQMAA
jgi:molecular chaperone HscA